MSPLISILLHIIPLASSSAAVICSMTQQLAFASFLHPRIAPSARHALFYPWITTFARVTYLSTPAYLVTALFCLLNLLVSNNSPARPTPISSPSSSSSSSSSSYTLFPSTEPTLWLTALLFNILHAYPLKLGLKLARISEEEWNGMRWEEGKRLIALFTEVNGRRLRVVDVWAWGAVVAATVVGVAGGNGVGGCG